KQGMAMMFSGLCAGILLACTPVPDFPDADLGMIGKPLPASAASLLASEAAFSPFAAAIAADVERILHSQPQPSPEVHKVLLSLRVHLALHFADDQRAQEAAEEIRMAQPDPGDRAVTGLITRAIVGARSGRKNVEPALLAPDAGRLLGQLLSTLACNEEVGAALQRSRARIAAITLPSLQRELLTHISPYAGPGTTCTLALADRMVRYRHQLLLMLPLRDTLIEAHDKTLSTYSTIP
ncbi:MAG TPA: hypothetical protein PLV87_10840, partial [Opitutaceae bacterium]|nr:hypothetical protein [Opitutaceae bacterium]